MNDRQYQQIVREHEIAMTKVSRELATVEKEMTDTLATMFAIYIVAGFVGALFMGFLGYAIAEGKGRGGLGFLLGFFVGPIGLIVAALLSPLRIAKRQAFPQYRPAPQHWVEATDNGPSRAIPIYPDELPRIRR